jgi:hypothetical protein
MQLPVGAAMIEHCMEVFGRSLHEQIAEATVEELSDLRQRFGREPVAVKLLGRRAGGHLEMRLTPEQDRTNVNAHDFSGAFSRSAENRFPQHSTADRCLENAV